MYSKVLEVDARRSKHFVNLSTVREEAARDIHRCLSVVQARRNILKARILAAKDMSTPLIEAPSGYHQGFVHVNTPYDQENTYRKWVVLDVESFGEPVLRICNKRNASPDDISRDIVAWIQPDSCVVHRMTAMKRRDLVLPTPSTPPNGDTPQESRQHALSISGVLLSTGASQPTSLPMQITLLFCATDSVRMEQWRRALIDAIPEPATLMMISDEAPDTETQDEAIEESLKIMRAKQGSHVEIEKYANLRVDDDFCASLGLWQPLDLESLKRKLRDYYAKHNVSALKTYMNEENLAKAAQKYLNMQQLMHYHLQEKYGAPLFDHVPPIVVDPRVATSWEDAEHPDMRPSWNHITDTFGYYLSGQLLKSRKAKQDIVSSYSQAGDARRGSVMSWAGSSSSMIGGRPKSSGDLHQRSLSHGGKPKHRSTMSHAPSSVAQRSKSSWGRGLKSSLSRGSISSASSTPDSESATMMSTQDFVQYELLIRGSHWTWSGGLPFPNGKGSMCKCKLCKNHRTMISNNYTCYVRLSKLEESPRPLGAQRATPQRLETTSEERLVENPVFPASMLVELGSQEVRTAVLRFDVCCRNLQGRSHFILARMELRASALLCRPAGTEITLCSRCGTWPGRLMIQILPPLWSNLVACPTTRPMGRSYQIVNQRTSQRLLVREECLEPYLTFTVPSIFYRQRHIELLEYFAEKRKRWEQKHSKPVDKYDSDALPEAWRSEYLDSLRDAAMTYADLSALYKHRSKFCVPFRSSREKSSPAWIRGVPVNLHMSLVSSAPYDSKEVDAREGWRMSVSHSGSQRMISPVSSMTKNEVPSAAKCAKVVRRAVELFMLKGKSTVHVRHTLLEEFGYGILGLVTNEEIDMYMKLCAEFPKGDETNISDKKRVLLTQKYGGDRVKLVIDVCAHAAKEKLSAVSSESTKSSDENVSTKISSRPNVPMFRYGQVTWGAPTVHCMGYEHGGLSELYCALYVKEERRLKQVQENTFDKKQIRSTTAQIEEVDGMIKSYEEMLKDLRSPQDIDAERMQRAEKRAEEERERRREAEEKEGVGTPKSSAGASSFWSRITGSGHDGVTPEPRTEEEKIAVKKWQTTQSHLREQKHKHDSLSSKLRALHRKLTDGTEKARKMLMERQMTELALTRRRDAAQSMALTATTFGFLYHLQQIAEGDPEAME
eukprot:g3121.t1